MSDHERSPDDLTALMDAVYHEDHEESEEILLDRRVPVGLGSDHCEDCGIRLDRHGEDCGIETTDPRYVPPPLGWADADGNIVAPPEGPIP